jgi:hypothetical protein
MTDAIIGLIIGCAPLILLFGPKTKIKYFFLSFIAIFSICLAFFPDYIGIGLYVATFAGVLFNAAVIKSHKKQPTPRIESNYMLIAVNGWGATHLVIPGALNSFLHAVWPHIPKIHDVGGAFVGMMSMTVFFIIFAIAAAILEKVKTDY